MCMACEEMDLYYAYLDAVEAEKRAAQQDWQCAVTLFPQPDEAAAPAAEARPAAAAKFVCDEPE